MRYLGAPAAVLAAAMTFSLPLPGQAARASEDKPTVEWLRGRNAILPPSASSSTTITDNIERYVSPPTLLQGVVEYNPATCIKVDPGGWTHTPPQLCGKDASGNDVKCGQITRGTVTSPLPGGACPGVLFTFATIYYEWTAHNNQSNLSAPADKVADTFDGTWTTTDGKFAQAFTFDINVPVVRPDHETTAFQRWSTAEPTVGKWQQTLVPPSSDPTFDFSGESVQEADPGGGGPDTCWFVGSDFFPFTAIRGGTWTVGEAGKNVWEFDNVGWCTEQVTYYRNPTPPPPPTPPYPSPVPCGTTFPQQMNIKAPSDATYRNYGAVNVLGGSMTQTTVTSERAGSSETKKWP